jgi:Amt family ammonium transporter
MDLGYGADMDDYVPRKGKVRIASASKEETKVSRDEGTYLGESSYSKATEAMKKAAVPVSEELPLDPAFATGMHKVTIICRLSKFDALKKALNELGVSGMTMSQVMGCGIQKGSTERYRGTIVDSTLLPKVKVEVIIGKISVEDVIDASKKALYTGHIGDGKIFVYNVARVVKVRTGEEGIEALQDVE